MELPDSYHFCDNEKDADICADLVVAGIKQATASSVAELQHDGYPMPEVGDFVIITDWAGQARAIIKTTHVEIRPYRDVDETFARREGEGDLSLKWWRAAHEAYYRRVLQGTGTEFSEDMPIVLEIFELVKVISTHR